MIKKAFNYVTIVICVIFALVALMVALGEAGSKVNRGGKRADAIITADYAHHEIHEGNHYVTVHQATIASGASYLLLINTPANKDVHLIGAARSTAEAHVELYESPIITALGTSKDEINRNRNSSKVSGTEITLGPTFTNLGAKIFEEHFGSGQNTGSSVRSESEFILKRSTLYIVNSVSEAAGNDVQTCLDYYEDNGDAP